MVTVSVVQLLILIAAITGTVIKGWIGYRIFMNVHGKNGLRQSWNDYVEKKSLQQEFYINRARTQQNETK